MKKYIVSADIGKFETEILGREIDENKTEEDIKLIRFRTKNYNLADGYIELQGNSHLVKFEGQEYIVGEQGQDKSYDTSKTNILHKLCFYTAITQLIKPEEESEIYVVLACPLSVLQINEAKEEYKKYLQGEGNIEIEVDGKKYKFTVKDIMAKAEGSGITYLEPTVFKGKSVGIVDLGGLNMGFSLYRNGVCNKESRFIEECGTDRLIEIVKEQLSIYKNGNLTDTATAEKALNEGGLKKAGKIDSASAEYIKKAKEKYLEEVQKYIKEHKFNADEFDSIVFVGGTSQHIIENIKNAYDHAYIPEDPQLSNVKGLYKVAYKKWYKLEN